MLTVLCLALCLPGAGAGARQKLFGAADIPPFLMSWQVQHTAASQEGFHRCDQDPRCDWDLYTCALVTGVKPGDADAEALIPSLCAALAVAGNGWNRAVPRALVVCTVLDEFVAG